MKLEEVIDNIAINLLHIVGGSNFYDLKVDIFINLLIVFYLQLL